MSNRLYLGNLAFHVTEDLINKRFTECGEVSSVSLVIDRTSGQSRGFAFVEMATAEGAQKALAENGKDFEGRSMRVDVAEERRNHSGGGRGGGGFGGGRGGGGYGGGGGRRGR